MSGVFAGVAGNRSPPKSRVRGCGLLLVVAAARAALLRRLRSILPPLFSIGYHRVNAGWSSCWGRVRSRVGLLLAMRSLFCKRIRRYGRKWLMRRATKFGSGTA